MLQNLVSIYNIKERYGKVADNSDILPVAARKGDLVPLQVDKHPVL